MKRVNRITFDKLRAQWEILKMRSAYISAERAIIQDPSLTNWEHQDLDKELREQGWRIDPKPQVEQAIATLEHDLKEIEKQGHKLLEDENYEDLDKLRKLYFTLQRELNRLRGN